MHPCGLCCVCVCVCVPVALHCLVQQLAEAHVVTETAMTKKPTHQIGRLTPTELGADLLSGEEQVHRTLHLQPTRSAKDQSINSVW